MDVKVGKRNNKNARIVNMRDEKRSLIRRDRLNQLNFRVEEANGNSQYTNIIQNISEHHDSEHLKQIIPVI